MACLQQDVAFPLVAHCCELHIISAIIYINVCVFDVTSGALLEKMKRHKNGVRDLAVSSDHQVASVSFDKTCVVSK